MSFLFFTCDQNDDTRQSRNTGFVRFIWMMRMRIKVWRLRTTPVSKETYYSVKRDLLQCQKRPTTVSKETYYSVKRDLLHCQKRPTTLSRSLHLTEECRSKSIPGLMEGWRGSDVRFGPLLAWNRRGLGFRV